jgi:hypothetical protein
MNVENREITVIFDDKSGVSMKSGVCTEVTDFGITLDDKDLIPLERIIRISLKKNG